MSKGPITLEDMLVRAMQLTTDFGEVARHPRSPEESRVYTDLQSVTALMAMVIASVNTAEKNQQRQIDGTQQTVRGLGSIINPGL